MDKTLNLCLRIPFPQSTEAEIAYNSLRVDKEVSGSGVSKVLSVEGNTLVAKFTAPSAKPLRTAITSFMELIILVTETIQQFGPPVSNKYSYLSS